MTEAVTLSVSFSAVAATASEKNRKTARNSAGLKLPLAIVVFLFRFQRYDKIVISGGNHAQSLNQAQNAEDNGNRHKPARNDTQNDQSRKGFKSLSKASEIKGRLIQIQLFSAEIIGILPVNVYPILSKHRFWKR